MSFSESRCPPDHALAPTAAPPPAGVSTPPEMKDPSGEPFGFAGYRRKLNKAGVSLLPTVQVRVSFWRTMHELAAGLTHG
jgi:hypothetical protein